MILRKPRTKARLKERIVCRKCFTAFENKSLKNLTSCPKCNSIIDGRDRSGEYKKWCVSNPEKAKKRLEGMIKYNRENSRERGKITRERVKKTVFNILSNNNPKCVNCGCDDFRVLEVNHKNGGGNKELRAGKNTNAFMWNIYMGRRCVEDLNLLCRVCNALDYLERKYGKTKHTILWKS